MNQTVSNLRHENDRLESISEARVKELTTYRTENFNLKKENENLRITLEEKEADFEEIVEVQEKMQEDLLSFRYKEETFKSFSKSNIDL